MPPSSAVPAPPRPDSAVTTVTTPGPLPFRYRTTRNRAGDASTVPALPASSTGPGSAVPMNTTRARARYAEAVPAAQLPADADPPAVPPAPAQAVSLTPDTHLPRAAPPPPPPRHIPPLSP